MNGSTIMLNVNCTLTAFAWKVEHLVPLSRLFHRMIYIVMDNPLTMKIDMDWLKKELKKDWYAELNVRKGDY